MADSSSLLPFYVRAAQIRHVDGFDVSLIDREALAARHYCDGRGRRGDARRAAERARREVAWQARRMRHYRAQGAA